MHDGHDFIPLLLVTGASLVVVLIALRIRVVRIPIVVGEIVIGMVIGRSGFQLIPADPGPWLSFLSLFGFTMLMFLSGLEIDFAVVRRNLGERNPLRGVLGLALATFAGSLLLSFGFSLLLYAFGMVESALIMALILSTTSVGIVVPLLKERAELNSDFGQALLLAAVVADFATMFLITLVAAVHLKGGLTIDVAIILLLFLAFLVTVNLGRRFKHTAELVEVYREGATATAQIRVRTALTVMLLFIVLSQFTGTEIILGAFLAGAAVSVLSGAGGGRLGKKLDAIGYGFLIPYFFIMVGARFDFSELVGSTSTLLMAPLLVAIAFVVKLVPATLFTRRYGRRRALAGGFLLSARLSLVIAAAAIGVDMEVISPAVNSAIILVAVITCLTAPMVYSRLLRGQRGESEQPTDLEPLIGHLVDNPDGLHLMLAQVAVSERPSLAGLTLAQTQLRKRTGVTVIALRHGDGQLVENPPADAELSADDWLVVIGSRAQITSLRTLDRDNDGSRLPES